MFDSDFQILFLGENSSWSTVSQALAAATPAGLHVHRLDSIADLFRSLADGRWHAVLLDVHAWNYLGLHFVEKIRSEYPAFPILALYSPSVPELESKALTSGASRCLPLDGLTADSLRRAMTSCIADQKSQSHLRKATQMQLSFNAPDATVLPSSRNQVITHALTNLLCVITAHADILSDQLNSTGPGSHGLAEIKKAAQSATALLHQIK